MIKPALTAGTEEEIKARLAALNNSWWKAELKVSVGKRILVLSAHPDDESIGAGGFLLAHRQKAEIQIVTIFSGSHGGRVGDSPKQDTEKYRTELAQVRLKELEAVGQVLGASSVSSLGLDDGASVSQASTGQQLREIIERFRPDMVLLPWFLDNHPDHRAANILYASVCSEISCMVLAYEIWSLSTPNATFDITDYLEEKVKLIENYQSQVRDIDYAGYARGLARTRAFLHGISKGSRLGAGEGFLSLPNRDYCDLVRSLYGTISNPTEFGEKYL